MNAFDRAIAAVAPSWGLSRVRARTQMEILRKFDAAGSNRRTKGWRTDYKSASAEIEMGGKLLRSRARDLANNNPFASGAVDKLTAYQVGTGIVPRSATGDAETDKAADAVWNEWAAAADWGRQQDIYGIQSLAARCRIVSGETLLQWMPLSKGEMQRRGMRIPMTLTVKEPDWLDELQLRGSSASGYTIQGIEFDWADSVTGYWMHSHHPGDTMISRAGLDASLVPASQVMHVFRPLRPGQIRGISELRSSMLRLRMTDDAEDAALEALRTQACLVALVTSTTDGARGPLAGSDAGDGERRMSMRPGMIERLRPGEDVTFSTPPASNGFGPMVRHQLHAIAEGLGLTYDLLTGDLSSANYSSLRAGRLAFKRRLEDVQWLCLIPRMCEPVWQRVMQLAQMMGVLAPRAGAWPVAWAPPRFEMLDPAAEMKAMREGVRDGFMTWGQAVAEMGNDPHAQIAEIAKYNTEFDDAGIILDTDPRRVAGASGTAQDAAQNAHVEIAAKSPD